MRRNITCHGKQWTLAQARSAIVPSPASGAPTYKIQIAAPMILETPRTGSANIIRHKMREGIEA